MVPTLRDEFFCGGCMGTPPKTTTNNNKQQRNVAKNTLSQKAIQIYNHHTPPLNQIRIFQKKNSQKKLPWISKSPKCSQVSPRSPQGLPKVREIGGLGLSPVGLWCLPGLADPHGQGPGASWPSCWENKSLGDLRRIWAGHMIGIYSYCLYVFCCYYYQYSVIFVFVVTIIFIGGIIDYMN